MSGTGGASPYRKGASFENKTAAWLRELGCLVVRAAGSKGAKGQVPFDLVSIIGSRPSLIECKLNGRLDPGPKAQLIEAAKACGAFAVLAKPSKTHKGEITFVQLYRPEWPEEEE